MVCAIRVEQPGLLTTIQDQGRRNYLPSALSRGGAQDAAALATANLLVGNDESAAGLEITGLGPTLFFEHQACIACCGAPVKASLSVGKDHSSPLPLHRPVIISAGATIRFAHFLRGFRAWIAFAGGIDSPVLLESRSSHLAAELGPLRITAKTRLTLGPKAAPQTQQVALRIQPGDADNATSMSPAAMIAPRWSLASHLLDEWPVLTIPVVPGRHFEYLADSERSVLFGTRWLVEPRSNRQGLALSGPALKTSEMPQIMSEPVRFGTVQLPSGGKPFVLMSEHQTTGGYPRILEVISAARPLLAQASPESRIVFLPVDLAQAKERSALGLEDQLRTRTALKEKLGW